MFITACVLKSSPSIHSGALNCEHTKATLLDGIILRICRDKNKEIPKQRKYRQSNCCLDTCSKHRVIWVKCSGATNRKPLLQLHVLKYCKLFRSRRISYMTHKSDWLRCAMCIPILWSLVFKLQRWWNLPKWLWADWRRPVVKQEFLLNYSVIFCKGFD